MDNIGNITYISENGRSDRCGALDTKWFPYQYDRIFRHSLSKHGISSRGKYKHHDVYQAPYIWVQFNNPKPHVLIDVVCRLYAENIQFNKIRAQASTRFQIYVNDFSTGQALGADADSWMKIICIWKNWLSALLYLRECVLPSVTFNEIILIWWATIHCDLIDRINIQTVYCSQD